MAAPRLRIGLAGGGAAGQAFIAAFKSHEDFDWVAVADPVPAVREALRQAHGVAAHETLAGMLARTPLDAVCIATPTPLHAEHVRLAAAAGTHVLVEKPMAVTLDDARAIVAAAEAAGVCLLVGHAHGYDAPIAAMRQVIDSGAIGAVRMVHNWCYTDWVQRPRRADELDSAQGGGVTFRQGSHQFDIIRLLCGGRARSVRAQAFDWNPRRRVVGAHTVFIDFEDGAAATAVYNGYGGFSSIDLCFDVGEWGQHLPPSARPRRPAQPLTPEAELQAKQARAAAAIPSGTPHQPFFGLTLVSGERGDLRQSPDGLLLYGEDGVQEIVVPNTRSPRERVLDEFATAIRSGVPPLHSGRWGLANLELCVAALASSAQRRELPLHEQVGLPAA
jgi:phthalate 4,5-cis-dihydrodiol dehydrogenase